MKSRLRGKRQSGLYHLQMSEFGIHSEKGYCCMSLIGWKEIARSLAAGATREYQG